VKSVRDFVLDQKLGDSDTVVLNYVDFADVALEFRETYKQSLQDPYIVLGVLVEPEFFGRVPVNRIGFIKNDVHRSKQIRNNEDLRQSLLNSEEIVFRCAFCGDIVDGNGEPVESKTYSYQLQLLETRKKKGFVRTIVGCCCHNKYPKQQENADTERMD
jgi:hypothetical protein